MSATTSKFRLISPHRLVTLGSAAAVATFGGVALADTPKAADTGLPSYRIASSEGEGGETSERHATSEGEAGEDKAGMSHADHATGGEGGEGGEGGGHADLPADVAYLYGLSFMDGHLQVGLALYEAGDHLAALAHMGHPLAEMYDRVEARLEAAGHGALREQIVSLGEAVENDATLDEVQARYAAVRNTLDVARTGFAPADQFTAYVALMRKAGDEYSEWVEGDPVAEIHEYQDAWGFVQSVRRDVAALARLRDMRIGPVAQNFAEYLAASEAAFGDLNGQGAFDRDSSVLYGTAARMELALLRLK